MHRQQEIDHLLFHERLRQEREARGLSQTAFAQLVGASLRGAQAWERGVSQPNAVYLTAMAAAGVDVIYLLTGLRMEVQVVEAFSRAARVTLEATEGQPEERERLAALHMEAMRMTLVPPITADEVRFVRAYRALGAEARKAIDATLAAVTPKQPARKR